jgi:hypothetical protein
MKRIINGMVRNVFEVFFVLIGINIVDYEVVWLE